MHPWEFEPKIPASEWPQTHALVRADTGIGCRYYYRLVYPSNTLCLEKGVKQWAE